MYQFTFSDLFAWVGGFHIAMHNLWWTLIAAIENDKYARETYSLNFRDNDDFNKIFYWDITKLDENLIPNHDILCGWFPCQAFSIAGYRKWFEDERWNLFFDLARIIEHSQPKAIFLENVKNLKSHDWWNTFKVILWKLEDMWYHVKYKVLNSCEYWWIPQNRERIYIVWFKDKKSFDKFEFPEPISLKLWVQDMLWKWADSKYYYENSKLFPKIKDKITDKNKAYQRRRIYVRENKNWVFPTLTANMWTWWHNVPLIIDNNGIRKLTPRECFRIQGFPENYKLPNLSDSHLYKQAWNAVTVPTVQRIWENILKALFW